MADLQHPSIWKLQRHPLRLDASPFALGINRTGVCSYDKATIVLSCALYFLVHCPFLCIVLSYALYFLAHCTFLRIVLSCALYVLAHCTFVCIVLSYALYSLAFSWSLLSVIASNDLVSKLKSLRSFGNLLAEGILDSFRWKRNKIAKMPRRKLL